MGKFIDLSGQVFGRLTVLGIFDRDSLGQLRWECLCSCGNASIVLGVNLRAGSTKSCGCITKERLSLHGLSRTPEYVSWSSCANRCYNPKCEYYHIYGGAGVTVCERWQELNGKGFLNFLEDMGKRPNGTSLNRVNGAKIYSKETCEWATLSLQCYDRGKFSNNKSGVTGVSWHKSREHWCCSISVLGKRIYLGETSDFKVAVQLRLDGELKYYGFHKTQVEDLKDEV